jgi:putative phage-type endonuclease
LQSCPFTIVQLVQGTPEWLEWRNMGIGASDAPTLMGENPWKTATELLREKRGQAREFGQNAAMARGTELEPEARQAYISRSAHWVQPACLQSSAYGWLRASVDGITHNLDAVVEIKCGESVYRKTSASGRVPGYYYGQLQHILAVTGLPSIDFWCYLPGRPAVLVPTERDDSYITRLLQAEFQFWTEVLRGR